MTSTSNKIINRSYQSSNIVNGFFPRIYSSPHTGLGFYPFKFNNFHIDNEDSKKILKIIDTKYTIFAITKDHACYYCWKSNSQDPIKFRKITIHIGYIEQFFQKFVSNTTIQDDLCQEIAKFEKVLIEPNGKYCFFHSCCKKKTIFMSCDKNSLKFTIVPELEGRTVNDISWLFHELSQQCLIGTDKGFYICNIGQQQLICEAEALQQNEYIISIQHFFLKNYGSSLNNNQDLYQIIFYVSSERVCIKKYEVNLNEYEHFDQIMQILRNNISSLDHEESSHPLSITQSNDNQNKLLTFFSSEKYCKIGLRVNESIIVYEIFTGRKSNINIYDVLNNKKIYQDKTLPKKKLIDFFISEYYLGFVYLEGISICSFANTTCFQFIASPHNQIVHANFNIVNQEVIIYTDKNPIVAYIFNIKATINKDILKNFYKAEDFKGALQATKKYFIQFIHEAQLRYVKNLIQQKQFHKSLLKSIKYSRNLSQGFQYFLINIKSATTTAEIFQDNLHLSEIFSKLVDSNCSVLMLEILLYFISMIEKNLTTSLTINKENVKNNGLQSQLYDKRSCLLKWESMMANEANAQEINDLVTVKDIFKQFTEFHAGLDLFQTLINHYILHNRINDIQSIFQQLNSKHVQFIQRVFPQILKYYPKESLNIIQFILKQQNLKNLPLFDFSYAFIIPKEISLEIYELLSTDGAHIFQKDIVHDLKIYLLSNNLTEFENYFKNIFKNGRFDKEDIEFDLNFALFQAKLKNSIQGQCYIYGLMGEVERAIELAINNLMFDVAHNFLELINDSSQIKKYIDLIVKKMLKSNQPLEKIFQMCDLNSNNYFVFQNFLPYFNKDTNIEEFKKELIHDVKKTYHDISSLEKKFSQNLKLHQLVLSYVGNNNSLIRELSWEDKCFKCNEILFADEFLNYPCGHQFHINCLLELKKQMRGQEYAQIIEKIILNIKIINKKIRIGQNLKIYKKIDIPRDLDKNSSDFLVTGKTENLDCDDIINSSLEKPDQLKLKKLHKNLSKKLCQQKKCPYCGKDIIAQAFTLYEKSDDWNLLQAIAGQSQGYM